MSHNLGERLSERLEEGQGRKPLRVACPCLAALANADLVLIDA